MLILSTDIRAYYEMLENSSDAVEIGVQTSNNRPIIVIVTGSILVALATTMVVARLITRVVIIKNAGKDEVTIALACVSLYSSLRQPI